MELLRDLFSNPLFMPHGHCYLWEPGLLWLQVITNLLIGISYVAIAATLGYLARKGRYVPFKGMAVAFGVFIISCAFTHFMDVYVIWEPAYWLDGWIRAITAVASVGTAVMLPPLVPKALALARGARKAHARGVELEAAMDDLERVYEKTRELEQLKTQFFANVSHELRTPLALILGPVEKLASADNLTDAQRRDCGVVTRNARSLLKHVNDLLDVSKLEAGKLAPDYVRLDVARLIRRLAGTFEVLAAERRTDYVVDVPEALESELDADKLQRVVINMLSNAFKFSPPGGRVRCQVSGTPDERLVLEVADSGPGVSPEHRGIIFERFAQLEGGSTRAFGGTGLGLAISREFVELMGGTIEVREAEEGGALFRVELPRWAPEGQPVREAARSDGELDEQAEHARRDLETQAADVAAEPEDGDRPVVLVVEDNPEMNRFVCETLGELYRCESALDGESGLARALELEPDLIVSDVMMPRMSGDRLVAEVRAHPQLEDVPIVLLTAKADDELRIKLLAEGAQDYVMKPFSTAELLARAANLVTMKRARAVLQREIHSQVRDLEALAGEVAHRNRQLATALDSMRVAREHAERASKLKSSFLNMVSHELRSPLATLGIQLEQLRLEGEGEGAWPPEKRQVVDRMVGTTRRLEQLIEGLLSYTRIQSGRIEPEVRAIDVGELTREAVEELRPRAEQKGLTLELSASDEALEPLQSDPRLLHLVLVNLLGNAVKFTSSGGVSLTVERDGPDRRFVVTDTGPGIAPRDQARIFEPFVQSEPTAHKHTEGIGLGLAIVRELVTGLQGTVQVTSEIGSGTTFTVILRDFRTGTPDEAVK